MKFDKDGNPIKERFCPLWGGKHILCDVNTVEPGKCETCGWNPIVSEQRIKKLRKE